MNLQRHACLTLLLLAFLVLTPSAGAHCQIPCGIFDDEARFVEMLEHVTTIEKAMKHVVKIGGSESPDWNQLVRWVNNKDEHADQLSEIVTYYFLAQRIKTPSAAEGAAVPEAARAKYVRELSLLHRILVHAMKAKQSTDLEHVSALRALIEEFRKSYAGK